MIINRLRYFLILDMELKRTEKYSTIPIKYLEEKVEKELLPAAFRICQRIEKAGREELEERFRQFISTKCPLRRCAILNGNIQGCPNHLCWIAEGPTWPEFLLPEINDVYLLLMYTYIEALDIPDNPDEEISIRESPLDVLNRKLKTDETQKILLNLFHHSEILRLRISVMRDIIWAHNNGKYALSVPCLITQIEGILHDLAFNFKWEFEDREMYWEETARVWAIIKNLGDSPFENALTNFYTRKGRTSYDSPRNLILHGRSIDYGEDYKLSTVLFLILIYLLAFSQMKIQGRVTYM